MHSLTRSATSVVLLLSVALPSAVQAQAEWTEAVVESLLREVLAIQSAGDLQRAGAFVDRWATWDGSLHGVIAQSVGSAGGGGYRLVRYGALVPGGTR